MLVCNLAIKQDQTYTDDMSDEVGPSTALGAYLKTLREKREYTVVYVRTELGRRLRQDGPVDQTRLWRTENPKPDREWPEGEFLIALMDIVGADISDVAWFQMNPQATAKDGKDRALARLSPEDLNADIKAVVEELNNEQTVILRRILNALFPSISIPQPPRQSPKLLRGKTNTSRA